jgi:hypothetical protein
MILMTCIATKAGRSTSLFIEDVDDIFPNEMEISRPTTPIPAAIATPPYIASPPIPLRAAFTSFDETTDNPWLQNRTFDL